MDIIKYIYINMDSFYTMINDSFFQICFPTRDAHITIQYENHKNKASCFDEYWSRLD